MNASQLEAYLQQQPQHQQQGQLQPHQSHEMPPPQNQENQVIVRPGEYVPPKYIPKVNITKSDTVTKVGMKTNNESMVLFGNGQILDSFNSDMKTKCVENKLKEANWTLNWAQGMMQIQDEYLKELLTESIKKIEEERAEALKMVEDLMYTIEEREEDIGQKDQEISTLNLEIINLNEDLQDLKHENGNLKINLDAAERKVEKLENKNRSSRTTNNRQHQQHEELPPPVNIGGNTEEDGTKTLQKARRMLNRKKANLPA